jgi:hypothetical protein
LLLLGCILSWSLALGQKPELTDVDKYFVLTDSLVAKGSPPTDKDLKALVKNIKKRKTSGYGIAQRAWIADNLKNASDKYKWLKDEYERQKQKRAVLKQVDSKAPADSEYSAGSEYLDLPYLKARYQEKRKVEKAQEQAFREQWNQEKAERAAEAAQAAKK